MDLALPQEMVSGVEAFKVRLAGICTLVALTPYTSGSVQLLCPAWPQGSSMTWPAVSSSPLMMQTD